MTSRAGVAVSVIPKEQATIARNDIGNVYLNDNRGPVGTRAPTTIEVSWQSDSVLVIRQDRDAHVVFAALKFAGVTIVFDSLPKSRLPTSPKTESSLSPES
jgi:hypothetical protein